VDMEADGVIVVGIPPHLNLAGTCFDPRCMAVRC
jgi:hypothetical protein